MLLKYKNKISSLMHGRGEYNANDQITKNITNQKCNHFWARIIYSYFTGKLREFNFTEDSTDQFCQQNFTVPVLLTILYSTVLYCTVLYCTVLYCTVLYCTVNCTVLYCTVLYFTVLYCIVLYCTLLYCTVLYCTVLYCTVL